MEVGACHYGFCHRSTPQSNNAVWVVVDRLTKSEHFIPFRVGQSTELLADKYMREIVRLHGVPVVGTCFDKDICEAFHLEL